MHAGKRDQLVKNKIFPNCLRKFWTKVSAALILKNFIKNLNFKKNFWYNF